MRLIDKDAVIKEMMKDPVGKMVANKYNMNGWLEGLQEVDAIPLDWIRAYIDQLKAMGVQIFLRDAQAVSVVVHRICGRQYMRQLLSAIFRKIMTKAFISTGTMLLISKRKRLTKLFTLTDSQSRIGLIERRKKK